MDNIIEPTPSFEFSRLSCISPTSLGGGNYFIRILQRQNPFYIQPPKCATKQGILKSGKKMYTDLLFRHEDEPFNEFMESLETFCKNQLFHFREKWFDSSLTEPIIEDSFTPISKLYKSGKFHSVRVNIPTRLGKCSLKIFDESEQEVPLEEIRDSSSLLTILEIQGIRCSSRTFQLDVEVKQMMVLKPIDLFETCLFSKKPAIKNSPPVETKTVEEPVVVTEPEVERTVEEKQEEVAIQEDQEDQEEEPIQENQDDIVVIEQQEEVQEEALEPELERTVEEKQDETEFISTEENDVESVESEENTLAKKLEGVDEINICLPTEEEESETITLKKRNHVYFTMYKEAKRKARAARDLAISHYLEAKKIRYSHLNDQSDSDEDNDEEDILDKEMESLEQIPDSK